MKIYRAGIIGLSRVGSWWDDALQESNPIEVPSSHAGMYTACPQTTLVAGCDTDPEKRAKFEQKWNVSTVYSDFREMLERESLDIVSIVTSWASVQGNIATVVAQSGTKGLYCEKPMATSVAQMSSIATACRENHVALVVPYLRRYNPRYIKVRELVASGAIGEVLTVHATAVGPLLHAGTHYLDIMNYLTGDSEPSWCVGRLEDTTTIPAGRWERLDPSGSGYFEVRNGIRYSFDGLSKGSISFLVSGTEGRILMMNDARDITLWRKEAGGNGRGFEAIPIVAPKQTQSLMYSALEDLVHALDTGEPTRCNETHAARTLEMALGIHESQHNGNAAVRFPLSHRDLSVDTW